MTDSEMSEGAMADSEMAQVVARWVEWDVMCRLGWGRMTLVDLPRVDVVDSEEWWGD